MPKQEKNKIVDYMQRLTYGELVFFALLLVFVVGSIFVSSKDILLGPYSKSIYANCEEYCVKHEGLSFFACFDNATDVVISCKREQDICIPAMEINMTQRCLHFVDYKNISFSRISFVNIMG